MSISSLALANNLRRRPWIYSFAAALLIWLITLAFSGGAGAIQSLQTAVAFAMFFVIVGIGQMLVISSGPGNIDLSVPSVMTLSGLVGVYVMDQQASMIVPGLACALAVGLAVGIINYALIRFLSIPPIIATLAMSFIVQSVAISTGGAATLKPPEMFTQLAVSRFLGVPVLPAVMMVAAALVVMALRRSLPGRSLLAVGQNETAAWLAGIDPQRVRFLVYVICATAAALAGILLAGFSGGAALDIGGEYQLASIAVVVIGGTSVMGGRAFPQGVWGAALFLYVLVNLLNFAVVKFDLGSAGPGIRLMLTGFIIVAIVSLARDPD